MPNHALQALRMLARGGPASRLWAFRRARDRGLTRWLRRSFASLGEGTVIEQPSWLDGLPNISMGARVKVGPASRLGAYRAPLIIGDGCEIVGGAHFFAQDAGIILGREVLVAWNVQIYDHNHASSDPHTAIRSQGFDDSGEVRIGDGAWLGANAVVLSNVTIGRNAIVAANSVVKQDVPDYGIVAGSPATLLSRQSSER